MDRRIVDLTYLIHEGMTTFPNPWHPVVEITQMGRHGIENRETRKFTLGTHTGTHCDAPRHFVEGGGTVEDIPLDLLTGPARVVDLSHVAERSAVTKDELQKAVGDDRPRRVLLRYDWSDNWGTMAFYQGHPYLTREAAQWLVDQGVELLGMDSPTPDDPRDSREAEEDSPVHKVLLGAGVILLEYLTNLREIRGRDVELFALPLKIKEGDGAPVRCIAIEHDDAAA